LIDANNSGKRTGGKIKKEEVRKQQRYSMYLLGSGRKFLVLLQLNKK
jgi:hypothetical protein